MQRLPRLKFRDHASLTRAVFLVTPTLAGRLLQDRSFLHDAMNRLYVDFPAGGQDKPLRSAVAVVDRLPGPINAPKDDAVHRSSSVLPPVVTAYEGFGLYLHEVLSDTYVPPEHPNGRYKRVLRFYLRATQPSDRSTREMTSLELRPANTLFVNGTDCIMFQDQWRWAGGQGGSAWLPTGRSEQLQSLDCHIDTLPVAIHLPIEDLTAPREIVSGMGNILRQLRGTDAGSTISASAELEKELPKFLKKFKKYSGTLSVFALITPSSNMKQPSDSSIVPTGRDLFDAEDGVIKDAISRDPQIHKVTSGGGGWGKKAGLLSLDPALDFEDVEMTGTSDDMQDLPDSEASESTSIVKPGDYVQFFATFDSVQHRRQHSDQDSIASASKDKEWDASAEKYFILGTVSSQDDQMEPAEAHSSPEGNLIYLPNHFGMLSEGGTCFKSVTSNQPVEETGVSPVDNGMSIVRSRMDIPYGAWIARSPKQVL